MARAGRTATEALLEQSQTVRNWLETLATESLTRPSVMPGRAVRDVVDDVNALLAALDERLVDGSTPAEAVSSTMIITLIGYLDDLNRSLPELDPIPLQRAALGRCIRTLAAILPARYPGRSVEVENSAVRGRAVFDERSRAHSHPRHSTERGGDRSPHVPATRHRTTQLERGSGVRDRTRLRSPRRPVGCAPAREVNLLR